MGAQERGYGMIAREKLIKDIISLHNQGLSQVKIANMIGVSRGTILRWNKELNFFETRTPGEAGKLVSKLYHYDEKYFEKIDSPIKAYIIGFLLGDGTISLKDGSSKRIKLELAEQDKELLYDIAGELGLVEAVKFRKRNAPNEQNKFSLTINSTKMADDLISLGIGPKKTGKEKWIDLQNDKLQWHFLRGLFDADGHIRVYQRTYKRKTMAPKAYLKGRFGITGNLQLLQEVLKFLKKHNIAKNVNSFSKKQGCYDLYVSSLGELRVLYHKLYSNGNLKMQRKFEKFASLNNLNK
jgi:hypothetical protein